MLVIRPPAEQGFHMEKNEFEPEIGKRPLAGGKLKELFQAYFNNRMMVLLMMIEHPGINRQPQSIERQRFFLEDLYHHFLPPHCEAKYRRAFEWLFGFLKRYPDVKPHRIYRGIQMVGLIYEAFGLELPKRIEAVRLEIEGMDKKRKR